MDDSARPALGREAQGPRNKRKPRSPNSILRAIAEVAAQSRPSENKPTSEGPANHRMPSALVSIVVLTAFAVYSGIELRTVGDMGELPSPDNGCGGVAGEPSDRFDRGGHDRYGQ
jgi:hypothetical protein